MMPRALISVHDKTGLEALGRGLSNLGFELVASGGTARALAGLGLKVRQVSEVTGFAEILDGRVKTLHPAIFGGILARRTPQHLAELEARGLAPVDLLACNLYPFVQTVSRPGVTEDEATEQIDIGGVALLRAAAKNFEAVTVLCDPADYDEALAALGQGGLSGERRRELALKAFSHTAAYDAAIAAYLARPAQPEPGADLPAALVLYATREQVMRYGENPHQRAALYRLAGAAPAFEQLRGKELSYNNWVDLEAARAMVEESDKPCVAIVKHTNPCGLAVADTTLQALSLALDCDPVSAFGSIIAVNREVDLALVEAIGKLFVEVLVAPAFTEEAVTWLGRKKKNCRVVRTLPAAAEELTVRSVRGGLLVQTPDRGLGPEEQAGAWKTVTHRAPTDEERQSLAFAWHVVRHVKSNAIVFVKGRATVGVGAGQMNRVDSVYLAARRAGERARGSVMASDAFFPFPDGVETAAAAGVTACIQPGGSVRDAEVTEAADRLGLAMVFAGRRHFRH